MLSGLRVAAGQRRHAVPVRGDDVAGPPHLQQRDDRARAQQRGDDVGQLDREVVRARELADGEGHAPDDRDRPRLAHAAPTVDHCDEDQRHDEREERRLAADHRAELVLGQLRE